MSTQTTRVAAMIRWLPAALLFCSCAYLRTPTVPMPYEQEQVASQGASTLVVLLPGIADGPEDFWRNGFVERIQASHPHCDVIAPDAHFGYYRAGMITDRLHADVIAPRADRYEQIWLVGVSLGGLGALAYATDHPGVVDGVILLAPFLGYDDIADEVRDAGGLQAWTPPDLDAVEDPARRRFYSIWTWCRGLALDRAPQPAVYLGYGEDDDFQATNQLLADALPVGRSTTRAGGHSWPVWKALFRDFVEVLPPRDLVVTAAAID